MQAHRMTPTVPVVELGHDADARRIWRPDCEPRATDPAEDTDLCAEFVVDLLVRALAEEVQVEIAQ